MIIVLSFLFIFLFASVSDANTQVNPVSGENRYKQAKEYYDNGYYTNTELLMQYAISYEPNTHRYYALMAEAQLKKSDYADALKNINLALVLSKNNPRYEVIKSEILIDIANYYEARLFLDSVISNNKQVSVKILEMRGIVAYQTGDIERAEKYFYPLYRSNTNNADYRYLLSLYYLSSAKYDEILAITNNNNNLTVKDHAMRVIAESMLSKCSNSAYDISVIQSKKNFDDLEIIKTAQSIYAKQCKVEFDITFTKEEVESYLAELLVAKIKSDDNSVTDNGIYNPLPSELIARQVSTEEILGMNDVKEVKNKQGITLNQLLDVFTKLRVKPKSDQGVTSVLPEVKTE